MSISTLRDVAQTNSVQVFYPLSCVRCDGPVLFRDQLARDIACILDVDDDVVSWSCRAVPLSSGDKIYRPDFIVRKGRDQVLVDGVREETAPDWVPEAAQKLGLRYEQMKSSSLPGIRLRNAKDLLRYARYDAALADRIRLLAALDECSSLSVAEALMIFRETKPMAGLASMILHRFVSIDLDERLIGPETVVRRKRD